MGGGSVEDFIKAELEGLLGVFELFIFDLNCFVLKQLVAMSGSECLLSFVEGSESTNNFDVGCDGKHAIFLLRGHHV